MAAMTPQTTDLEPDYPRKQGEGSRTETAYTVEARVNPEEPYGPIKINNQIFDGKWRRVIFAETPIGVPRCSDFCQLTIQAGMFSYAAAQALRWWLHAVQDASVSNSHSLQTRLVSHRLISNHRCEAISAHAQVGGDDISNWRHDQ